MNNKISHWIAMGFLCISALACNIGAGAVPEDPSGLSTPTIPAALLDVPLSSTACANPLLPIKVGATWNYKLTGPVADTFTRNILSIDQNGFTDQDVFGSGVTRQGKWNCDHGSLIALNPSEGGSASVSSSNVEVDFQTTELSGVTLPAIVHTGDSWTQTTTLEGVEKINGTDIPAKNQFSNTCTAIGPESITVEAGTFDTMRVDCQVNMNITITMNGQDIQNPVTFNSSNWYAENIGLIKTSVTGSGLDSTVELVSYSIP